MRRGQSVVVRNILSELDRSGRKVEAAYIEHRGRAVALPAFVRELVEDIFAVRQCAVKPYRAFDLLIADLEQIVFPQSIGIHAFISLNILISGIITLISGQYTAIYVRLQIYVDFSIAYHTGNVKLICEISKEWRIG